MVIYFIKVVIFMENDMPADSKNVSKVIIMKNEKVLVLTRADNGRFDLPGGHCHVGEDFSVGAIREVYEETKLVCLHLEEVAATSKKRVFMCKSSEGSIDLDKSENSEYKWMSKEEIFNLKTYDCTDVLVTAKAYFLEDPEFWKHIR